MPRAPYSTTSGTEIVGWEYVRPTGTVTWLRYFLWFVQTVLMIQTGDIRHVELHLKDAKMQ